MDAPRDYLQLTNSDERTAKGVPALFRDVVSFLRTRLFELYMVLVSALIGIVILVYLRWHKRPKEVRWFLRLWTVSFVYGAQIITGTRFRLEGLENIPDRPVIFVGNHQSYWESIAMTVFVPHINVVTKRAAMDIPVFGWGLRHAPMIPVDRDEPGQNLRRMMRQGKKSIRDGRSILIYPEGGRVPPGSFRPFTRGLAPLYGHCECDVVPFVTNAGVHWPTGFKIKKPGVVTVRFLPVIPADRDPNVVSDDLEKLLNFEKQKLLNKTS
ncbi:MAG: 1-acyl-sn-glycerol-3-phosphate acyltransferase [Rhodospirillaceae bacterium]|jgi:1-acyl-sn-glycerol-3-phosphate acyltransferase|nr:1-acyl-sn-glycerol-3-phosphate acyltransferase [Rhodospirillaceae bacterium]MBT6537557.1 1-acyl-sn-glycerol-3-phosphate acyltransferase [Rhodospirillaceae bacterium]